MNSIFAVNKPKGMSSHRAVNQIRRATGEKRVGHGGTLDPLASGVLIIAVGRENTKKLDQYVKGEKEYVAVLKLGFESETDDEEGIKTEINTKIKPEIEQINNTLKTFIGKIKQMPPLYSAIKIKGKAAYKYARKNQTVELKSRIVEIKEIELLEYNYPLLKIRVVTGPGTYIRSLARDLGRQLKTGAYLSDLERTRVGKFTIDVAKTLDNLD